ncbi:MAG: hypothetical protein IKS85_00195 [Lachnospiraceae bacterium]|nr:hypothetical protein [Lachnospiraceae bacterium]
MKTGMESRKTVTLYNLLFPIWILVWLPTPLWLLIIPGNYLIDRLVFTISAKKQKPKLEKKFFRKHTWKLFLFGFMADFIGSILLLIPLLIPVPDGVGKHYNQSFFGKFMNALQFNAFSNPAALLYTLFAIAVAGLLIIPGNYLIDRLVFTISAKKQKPKLEKKFFRKHTWKLFLFGFLADFIGSILLLIPLLIPVPDGVGKHYNQSFFGKFMNALQFNAFSNPAALLYTLFAIAVAGLLIYVFDKSVLMKTKEFEPEQAKKIAFLMAVITAPYLYLVPGQLFF